MKRNRESLLELKELLEDVIERLTHEAEKKAASAPAPQRTAVLSPKEEGSKGRLAIVVGHTRAAQGAFGVPPIGACEYSWNCDLAKLIQQEAAKRGHVCAVFYRDEAGLSGAYDEAETFNPDAVMELHFNADEGKARGTETLRGSQPQAVAWATCVHAAVIALFERKGTHDRGIKRLRPGDRGFQSVSQLETIPSVLIEPFFGDNPEDARLASERKPDLAAALASAFDRFVTDGMSPARPGGEKLTTAHGTCLTGEPSPVLFQELSQKLRQRMADLIVGYEGRFDSCGRLLVYTPPHNDGGGCYEVAGINERYHPKEARLLRDLIEAGKHEEAKTRAAEYIAQYTDCANRWCGIPAINFYLRDSAFNRGPTGSAKILQLALKVMVDGNVGPVTLAALERVTPQPHEFLQKLRDAREEYERKYIGVRKNLWQGLVNRWDKAFEDAEKFLT